MKILKKLLSRATLALISVVVQVVWIMIIITRLGEYFFLINTVLSVVSILAVVFIINRRTNPAVKLAWVVPILIFPLFGGVAYVLMGTKKPTAKMRRRIGKAENDLKAKSPDNKAVLNELKGKDIYIYGQAEYLEKMGYTSYKNTAAEYFNIGEAYYEALLKAVKSAEKFIFLEYFIIEPGYMWDSILEVLKDKAKNGVDVRLLYDDVGNFSTLPYKYYKQMRAAGIKCQAFNPFNIVLSVVMNNRDHRKIAVIDGNIGFTGGINLADEYINKINRFGHWKDTGVCIRGEGVWGLTSLFLSMWNAYGDTDENVSGFKPTLSAESDGIVIPYGDTPLDDETLSENVYLNLINTATKYVYICTPYLIIDSQTMTALCLAAKRGVDVKIMTPGIPDKKIVFQLTRSHYPELIENGVKIYEYTPGFLHAKSFVSDDKVAVVGTINLDYRSLYHHFECGCFFYDSSVVGEVKKDFLLTRDKSRLIHMKKRRYRLTSILEDIYYAVLRLFAPLM